LEKNLTVIGYTAALGDLIRLTTITNQQATEALGGAGLSKGLLVKAGVEQIDMDAIYPPEAES
jgi:hypothetical protein